MSLPGGCLSLGRKNLQRISSVISLPRHPHLTTPLIRITLVEMPSSSTLMANVEAEANLGSELELICMARVMTFYKPPQMKKKRRLESQAQRARSGNDYHARLPPSCHSQVPKYPRHASRIRQAQGCFPPARQSHKNETRKSQP